MGRRTRRAFANQGATMVTSPCGRSGLSTDPTKVRTPRRGPRENVVGVQDQFYGGTRPGSLPVARPPPEDVAG